MVVQQEPQPRQEVPRPVMPEYVEVAPRAKRARAERLHIELFAVGLHNPSHMEWTPDGRLLVSDLTAGKVFDITDGGDVTQMTPVADGLGGPAAIVPVDDRILVAESLAGRVSDIAGGTARTFANGINFPYSMALFEKEGGRRILVSEAVSEFRSQYLDIAQGGERNDFKVFISDIPRRLVHIFAGKYPSTFVLRNGYPLAEGNAPSILMNGCNAWSTRLMLDDGSVHLGMKIGSLGAFVRVPDEGGSAFDMLEDRSNVLASGLDPVAAGCIQHPTNGKVYITQPLSGEVRAFDPNQPGYLGFEPPVISGLNQPTCVRFSPDGEFMYACGQGDGVVWRVANYH